MKKIILTTIVVIASLCNAFAVENTTTEAHVQVKCVQGQVVDKNTNEVLAGVAVCYNGQKVYTDFDGKFMLSNVCGDKCTVIVTQISYEPQTVELNIQNTETCNVLLSKR